MAIDIKPVNGRLVLTTPNARLGGLNPAISDDEAVVMSQYNSIDARVTAIEEGTESLTIVEVGDGSVTTPSITFANDTNTGIYRIGANNIGITANGAKVVDINTAGVSVVGTLSTSTLFFSGDGTVGAPSHSFISDTDTGIYRIGANNIGIAANGTKVVDISTSGLAVTGTASASTTVTAGTLLISGDGAVGAPSHTFTNDLDCGLYRIGANNIGFSAGGSKILDIGTSGLGITGSLSVSSYIISGDGSVAAPAHSFISDSDTGLYRIGANNAGFACNGAKVLDISTSGLAVTGTLTSSTSITATTTVTATTLFFSGDGAVGAPTYSFVSDTDTGIYRIGANNIGIAANGAKVVDIATTGVSVTGTLSATTTVSGTGHLFTGSLTVSGAGTPQTLNTYAGRVTMTGVSDIAADASTSVVINNSLVTANTVGLVSLQTTTAAAGSTPRIESVTYGAGTITIVIRNSDPATATGAATYTFAFILFQL